VQVVDRTVHRAARGADDVGDRQRLPDRADVRLEGVLDRIPGRLLHDRAEAPQPARHLRAERVADLAGARRPGGQQLVAEHQHGRPRRRPYAQGLVAARRGHAEDRGVDRGAGGQQLLARVRLFPGQPPLGRAPGSAADQPGVVAR
jgi:hypothetical protein